MPAPDTAGRLRDALVASYRPYLLRRLSELGVAAGTPGLDEAIAEGEAWLAAELGGLLALPFRDQQRGPLEVFQQAMRYPTAALEAAGIPPVPRDPAAVGALPGDRHHLAPASSQPLGEEVWEAHLAWGAAKARAFRPTAALVSSDLMDRSRVEPVVEAAGLALEVWRSAEAAHPGPAVVLVDLTHPDADDVIRSLSGAGTRVVAFGPHVDDVAMVRARSLGAADAVPRSVFFRSLASLLPTVV
ncbi:MAG: hypothetical protein KQH83_09200 [Actinobacteria bacterium]|nr:hypothetical protein [Actinomycetota bacterium]